MNGGNNNFPAQYPTKYQRDQYIMPQQPSPQIVDEPMYREQPMTRNDWPMMPPPPPPPQIVQSKQSNSVWPEKLSKQMTVDDKASRKKGQSRDSEYSEEYIDEGQAEGDDVTTTEAPKKANIFGYSMTLQILFIFGFFTEASQTQKSKSTKREARKDASRSAQATEKIK